MQFSSSLLLKCPCLPGVKGIMCPVILLCYAGCICSEYGIDIKSWKSTKISWSISSYSSMLVACGFRTYVPVKGLREFCIFCTSPVGFTRVIRISQYSVILSLWESVYVLKSVPISFFFFFCKLFLTWGVSLVMNVKAAFIISDMGISIKHMGASTELCSTNLYFHW